MSLARANVFPSAKPARRSPTKLKKLSLRQVNGLIIVSIILLGLSYLFQINSLVAKGYQIKELQTEVKALQASGRDLELKSIQLQSIDSVRQKVSALNMVEAGSGEFVSIKPTAVALR
tara:strand:+ start:182 stop:535 length:354 start_codon:yes stop_codon:yes gene_type:complete